MPAAGGAPTPAPAESGKRAWVLTLIGGADRKGRWRVARRTTVLTLIGGPTLDLRRATLEGPDAEFTILTLIGGADVIVPEGIAVETSGFSALGGDDVRLVGPPAPRGAPVLRIRSYTLIGGTDVKDRARTGRVLLPRAPRPPRRLPPRPPRR